jgi:hypothetical protein
MNDSRDALPTPLLSDERMALLRCTLQQVEGADIMRWKADLEWCEVAALVAEIDAAREELLRVESHRDLARERADRWRKAYHDLEAEIAALKRGREKVRGLAAPITDDQRREVCDAYDEFRHEAFTVCHRDAMSEALDVLLEPLLGNIRAALESESN